MAIIEGKQPSQGYAAINSASREIMITEIFSGFTLAIFGAEKGQQNISGRNFHFDLNHSKNTNVNGKDYVHTEIQFNKPQKGGGTTIAVVYLQKNAASIDLVEMKDAFRRAMDTGCIIYVDRNS